MSMCSGINVDICPLGNMALPIFIEGSMQSIHVGSFYLDFLTNCFILSALYNKTRSLWICGNDICITD